MTLPEQFFNACKSGNLPDVKRICETKRLHIDVVSPEGWTGLIMSCFNQHVDVINYLIENKANVNATNKKGTSVFMYAKTPVLEQRCKPDILELLLNNGANINHLDCHNKSVLDYVNEKKDIELANWLISKTAKLGNMINQNNKK